MTAFLFAPPEIRTIPVEGESAVYPVHRIFCVGRNYAAHAAEMGNEVDRAAPFYFTKSLTAVCASGQTVPYPPGTQDYHHEMELAVMLGGSAFRVGPAEASDVIFGYASALDMTRRDLQQVAKDKRRPWDLGKDVENSAVFAPITRVADMAPLGPQRIHLEVNGELRQDAQLGDMIHCVPEVIAHLSGYYHLRPGDVIMTGTPAAVGSVVAGDRITGGIDGLAPISLTLGPAE